MRLTVHQGASASARPVKHTSRSAVQLHACTPISRPFTLTSQRCSRASIRPVSRRSRNVAANATEQPAQDQEVPPSGLTEEQDFDLLQTKVDALSKKLSEDLKGSSIYLIGMMGTGKTTVGRLLSYCLNYCFFDTDDLIEKYHQNTSVASIFANEGEDYFRTCETEVLKQLYPYKNLVVATGGGAVLRAQNWSYMQHGVVVWLSGPADLLAQRVVAEGPEKRPLLWSKATDDNVLEITQGKLEKLLEARSDKYRTADVTVSLEGTGQDALTGAPPPVVLWRILTAINKKVEEKNQERENMKNFKIEGLEDVPTMRVMPANEAAPEE